MLAGLSVLLVDDDADIADIVARRLFRSSALVRICNDAPTAMKAIADNPPDIVILDRQLGRHDGLELARRLRETCESLPILMLSGHCDDASIQEAFDAGVMRYLCKPFRLHELETAIVELTGAREH